MISEQITLYLESSYEYGKRIGEFMSTSNECIATLTIGRFKLYLDVDGEGFFRYQDELYEYASELTPTIVGLIRDNSKEIEWKQQPRLITTLEVGGALYDGEWVQQFAPELQSPLHMKVALVQWMCRAAEKHDEHMGFLTEAEKRMFEKLKGLHMGTLPFFKSNDLKGSQRKFHRCIEKDEELLNVLSHVESEVHHHPTKRADFLTVSWMTGSERASEEVMRIAQTVQ